VTAEEFKILQDRWAQIQALSLLQGSHTNEDEQANLEMCVMEAVAYVAGEPWSDHPQCACPTLTEFAISWNDALPSDADRDRLLKPLIPKLVGTRGSAKLAERRSYMALDWLIRVHTPKWLELVPALQEHVKALRTLPEIVDMAGAMAAGRRVRLAQTDAIAAWDAAGDAAWDAAGNAAWDAARAAARAAAWDAAWDAAGAAAWDAARAAAGAAARDALKPTIEYLQQSALDLFNRMLEAA
jgi:hypothetical protein